MELTEGQLRQIEELSQVNCDPVEIAAYLKLPKKEFLKEINTEGSLINESYQWGQLSSRVDIDKINLGKAREGGLGAIAQWKKDASLLKLAKIKNRILFDNEQKEYAQLQDLIEHGKTDNLPANIVTYWDQIDFIRSIYNKFNSKSYVVSALRLKWPEISTITANKLFSETLNFFYLDNEVKTDAWANIYADKMERLGTLAMEMDDLETARRCFKDAAELRGVGKEVPDKIPEELLDRRMIVYVIDPQKIGIPKIDRRELADIIDNIDITETQKIKLRRDAQIEDVPFELMENE
jgi:hypothetical protein